MEPEKNTDMSEAKNKNTPPDAGSPLNVRCDAALSAWDGALSGMYLETLYALSRLRIN